MHIGCEGGHWRAPSGVDVNIGASFACGFVCDLCVCVCAHCVWAAFRLACLVVQPAMFRRRLLTQPEPEPSSAAAAAASAAEVAALRGEVSALRAEVSALRASVAQHALVHEHLHSTQCLGQTIAHIDRCVSMCGCAGVWVCGWVRC